MKKFNEAITDARGVMVKENKERANMERIQLLESIQRKYNVVDFGSLKPNMRNAYKKMICEMWNPNTGLNKKGRTFVNENELPDLSKHKEPAPELVQKHIAEYAMMLVKTIWNEKVISTLFSGDATNDKNIITWRNKHSTKDNFLNKLVPILKETLKKKNVPEQPDAVIKKHIENAIRYIIMKAIVPIVSASDSVQNNK